MKLGLVGAGNMARGMVRGWGEPVVLSDPRTDVAQALADEVGGSVAASNAELAQQVDVVVLAHKPPQLEAVAEEVRPHATAIASILGGTPLEQLRAAYPGLPVVRLMPSVPVEIRQGVVLKAVGSDDIAGLEEHVARLGSLVDCPEGLLDVGTQLMSCAPAYWALLVEAQVDAGVKAGMPPDQAFAMVVQTMAGTAALLQERGDGDTLGARRSVTSPGGMTARGLAALERANVRGAFLDAMDAVVKR